MELEKCGGHHHIFLIFPDCIENFHILRNMYLAYLISNVDQKFSFMFMDYFTWKLIEKGVILCSWIKIYNIPTPENICINYNSNIFTDYIFLFMLSVNRFTFCVKVELYYCFQWAWNCAHWSLVTINIYQEEVLITVNTFKYDMTPSLIISYMEKNNN